MYCTICAGSHYSENCDNKINLKCKNCTKANEKYKTNRKMNHAATDFETCKLCKYLFKGSMHYFIFYTYILFPLE